jgi:hypothetical protein
MRYDALENAISAVMIKLSLAEPHRFDAVAIGIADEGRVISFMIVQPHVRLAVRDAPFLQGGRVKGPS